jgi:hypothetical protein
VLFFLAREPQDAGLKAQRYKPKSLRGRRCEWASRREKKEPPRCARDDGFFSRIVSGWACARTKRNQEVVG